MLPGGADSPRFPVGRHFKRDPFRMPITHDKVPAARVSTDYVPPFTESVSRRRSNSRCRYGTWWDSVDHSGGGNFVMGDGHSEWVPRLTMSADRERGLSAPPW